jgi:N-acetyl-gamma-glutamyl-phosphate reductase
MIKVGIIGATGLTGEILLKILINHPKVKLSYLASEHAADVEFSSVCPNLKGLVQQRCKQADIKRIATSSDIIFLAKPEKTSMFYAPELFQLNKKIIDFSADFRLREPTLYEKWYKQTHTCPELLEHVTYGLTELNKDKIKDSTFIANPGCYPTAAILALAPLLIEDIIDPDKIKINSLSGLSGAGRTHKKEPDNLFVSCYGDVRAYKIGIHPHLPEILQELKKIANKDVKIEFIPHIIPLDRGIYTTIYANLKLNLSKNQLTSLYKDFYSGSFFIRIFEEPYEIRIKNVVNTNFCDISFYVKPEDSELVIFSTIDNLGKGAAGQAVQNMNVMFGLEETLGITYF